MNIKLVKQNIENWINYLETIKGYSANTTEAYKRDVTEFFDFCFDMKLDTTPPDKYVIREYLSYLSKKDITRPTVARKDIEHKKFLNFC